MEAGLGSMEVDSGIAAGLDSDKTLLLAYSSIDLGVE